MKEGKLVHLLPLIYYVVTRTSVTLRELSRLLGLPSSTVRKLLWSARRAGLVDYRRANNSLVIEPTHKSLQLIGSIEFFARRRNKAVAVIGGGIIYIVMRPRRGIRAYPIPLKPLCILLEEQSDIIRTSSGRLNLPPKTVSLLKRVLATMGCPSTVCFLNDLCKKNREGNKE